MKDRVSQHPGRFRMTDVGGGLVDLELADQPLEAGTPLNKTNLLKDETAELFGLGDNAVPDDVLAFIGNRISNVYVWARRTYQQRTQPEKVRSTSVATTNSQTKYYADAYTFDASTGIFTLTSPTSGTYNSSLRGKWWAFSPTSTVLYYSSSSAFFSETSIAADEYTVSPIVGEWEYVNAAERNAYPDSGVSGGYEYQFFGSLGNKVQIATGSYVGTGTYGSGNKNSLALSFPAKYVVVLGKAFSGYSSAYSAFINVEQGAGLQFSAGSAANTNGITAQNSGNTVQWYAQGALQQMNTNGTTYIYVAIG